MTTDYNQTDGPLPTARKQTGHNFQKTTIPTNIHTANRIFTNILLIADKHNIPKGKMHSNCRLLPEDIVYKITQRNNIRRANTCDPALKLLNTSITFNNKIATTPKHIANCFTKQFTNTVKHATHKTNSHINKATYKDTTSHSLLLRS